MSQSKASIFLITIAVVAALLLRLPRLNMRTMHTDEAVHAAKFAELLEDGNYKYDRHEYHGPTLNYFTLSSARLFGQKDQAHLTETTLRIVPVFFGILLILLLIPLRTALGPKVVALAAILIALSPAFAFYSRYYIQEMLLVAFTFAAIVAGYHYLRSRKTIYAILTGVSLGLMHATKETCVIACASMVAAMALVILTGPKSSAAKSKIAPAHIVIALVSFAVVSVTFFSSYFTNSGGIVDSVLTYADYFNRAGQNTIHVHPWYYYLNILSGFSSPGRVHYGGIFILLSALLGIRSVLIFRKQPQSANIYFLRFIVFYTIITTFIYSMIPYKTPWCLLNFHIGIIILAAVGIQAALARDTNLFMRSITVIIIMGFGVILGVESYRANFVDYENPTNPYVYAHSLSDVVKITDRIQMLAQSHPDSSNMMIEIVCSNSDYWPIPWYLRKHNTSAIGYYNSVDLSMPSAPVIIVSPDNVSDLTKKLYELPPPGQKHMYVPLFSEPTYLRPQVEIITYVRKDLYDLAQQQQLQLEDVTGD